MLGIPLVVLAAMASLIALGETPRAVTGQHITVRTQGTGFSSALVYGAGMGVRLVRVTHEGTPLSADLGTGPMHIISLRALHLDASGLSDQRVRLTATGHTLRLQQDARGVGVRTGL